MGGGGVGEGTAGDQQQHQDARERDGAQQRVEVERARHLPHAALPRDGLPGARGALAQARVEALGVLRCGEERRLRRPRRRARQGVRVDGRRARRGVRRSRARAGTGARARLRRRGGAPRRARRTRARSGSGRSA